jgi:hypothetical protein
MASIPVIPATPTPVFVTEVRKERTDDRPLEVERTVDISPETKKMSDGPVAAPLTKPELGDQSPIEETLSDVRPVIERLDGQRDISAALETNEPDQDDRSLQASEAYQALREPEADLTPVGTI